MQEYSVVLKNEKYRLYKRITSNAILLNALLLCAFCFSSKAGSRNIFIALAGIAAVISFFLVYRQLQKNNSRLKTGYGLLFALFIPIWLLLHGFPLALIDAVCGVLSVLTIRTLIVHFYPGRITYPSFPKKNISWDQLNAIILKDGLLTIDFKNNKIIQQYLQTNDTTDEKKFNEFCSQQLKRID